ncbi:MAG: hypothetical protein V4732_17335 [Pseudomonadota bacterium]
MGLHLVLASYNGMAGVLQVRNLQHDLNMALQQEDWMSVRRLDQACVVLIDKVIAANKDDSNDLILVLQELKDVYAGLIALCHHKVSAMAR